MKQFNTDAALLRSDLDQIKSKLSAPALVSQWREQKFWFDNLIQNGTFDTDVVGWVSNTYSNGSIAYTADNGGGLRITCNGGTGYPTASGAFSSVVGRQYLAKGDWRNNTTGAWGRIHENTSTAGTDLVLNSIAASGNFSGIHVATSTITYVNLFAEQNNAGSVDFDNVTVFETDGTDIIHRLPEGWTPHHVYVDGLLIREGAAHDYTVETDNFDTWIKPAVAPGALTETCIMGVRKV